MTPQEQVTRLLTGADRLSTSFNRGTVHWQRWQGPPDARPLLLLHGGFGSWTHWIANIPELCKSRTLWAVDLPGLGETADVPEPHTVDHFAAIILDSLDQLFGTDSEFDIAGFSFGALIGAQLAKVVQSRCSHFVACGAAGFGDLHVQVSLLRPPGPKTSPADAESIHRQNLRKLMFSPDYNIDSLAVHVHGENLRQSRFNSRPLARGDAFITAIPDIQARLCGIWGAMDATAGGIEAIDRRRDLFRAAQPECSFHTLDGIGHWAMYEAADAFNALLLQELGRR